MNNRYFTTKRKNVLINEISFRLTGKVDAKNSDDHDNIYHNDDDGEGSMRGDN